MANIFKLIPFVVSGICFSILVSAGIGYVKFLNMEPGFARITVVENLRGHIGELKLENNEYCYLNYSVEWPSKNIPNDSNRYIFRMDSVKSSYIPIAVTYTCEFMFFQKTGSQLVYATIE